MRNYASEIHGLGISVKDISKKSGLSESYTRRLISGSARTSSRANSYKILRNINRTETYRWLRSQGYSVKQAQKYRRTYTQPIAGSRTITRQVKSLSTQNLWQYHILGDFIIIKTATHVFQHGFSQAGTTKKDVMGKCFPETPEYAAVQQAKREIGQSCELVKLIYSNWQKYELKTV